MHKEGRKKSRKRSFDGQTKQIKGGEVPVTGVKKKNRTKELTRKEFRRTGGKKMSEGNSRLHHDQRKKRKKEETKGEENPLFQRSTGPPRIRPGKAHLQKTKPNVGCPVKRGGARQGKSEGLSGQGCTQPRLGVNRKKSGGKKENNGPGLP